MNKWINIWTNLLLRLLLAGIVVHTQHWLLGDSHYYLHEAERVCGGFWGGHESRTPGYLWLLCACTPKGTLFVQTLLVWAAGAWLSRRTTKTIGAFWLFDPGLLIYSTVFMSDAFFAAVLLVTALYMEPFLPAQKSSRHHPGYPQAVLLGIALASTILVRNVGVPLAVYSAPFLAYAAYRKRIGWGKLATAAAVTLVLLTPRLYWDVTRFGTWSLATQGSGWIDGVAAYVLYYGTGLDPIQSELRFAHEHAVHAWSYPYQVILQHFPTWCWLNVKSVVRILIGHLNTEWSGFFLGEPVIGPGWFKYSAQEGKYHVTGWLILPWVLGLFATAAYCVYVYVRTFLSLKRARRLQPYAFWALGALVLLILLPQVWGDARFRTSIWPLVLVLWGWGERNRAASQQ